MFQSVRQNTKIYILHKGDNPAVEVGIIVTNPTIKPKYSIPKTFGQQEMIVDISVDVNGVTNNFKDLPANVDIADIFVNGGCVTVSDNKDAINSEILSLKKRCQDIIDGYERNKQLVCIYDNLLKEINPEFAEKQEQKEEIALLKTQMKTISDNMEELMNTNRLLAERLSLNKSI